LIRLLTSVSVIEDDLINWAISSLFELYFYIFIHPEYAFALIDDAGWVTFCQGLKYFGERYGRVTVAAPPCYTRQSGSRCGETVKTSLRVRTKYCPLGRGVSKNTSRKQFSHGHCGSG
jgi:hypothetical protein